MPLLRFKIIEAFGFLCQETCIILYWMGLWTLLEDFTPLLNSAAFNIFCLVFGAAGLFTVKAVAPALILKSVEESSQSFCRFVPPSGRALLPLRRAEHRMRHAAKAAQ